MSITPMEDNGLLKEVCFSSVYVSSSVLFSLRRGVGKSRRFFDDSIGDMMTVTK